jgi:predicted Zn-dependent protease
MDTGPDAEALQEQRAEREAVLERKERKQRKARRPAARKRKRAAAAPAAVPAPARDRGRVYLVPLDRFPAGRARALASQLERKLRVRVSVTRRKQSPSSAYYAKRKQIVGDAVTRLVLRRSPLLADPGATVIGLTNRDMFILGEDWKFAFSLRDGRVAVVSSARMNPTLFGLRADDELIYERLRKMVLKNVSILHFNEFENDDPRSVLYGNILSTDDLDFMTEDVTPRESRAQRRWVRKADATCDAAFDTIDAMAARYDLGTRKGLLRFLAAAIRFNSRFLARIERLGPSPNRRLHAQLMRELRAGHAADQRSLGALRARWTQALFERSLRDGLRRNLVFRSLFLRLGSEACADLYKS